MKRIIIPILLVAVIIVQACSNAPDKSKENDVVPEESVNIKIESVSIELIDDEAIKVLAEAKGKELEYAYYIYKNDELLEKIPYKKSANQLDYELNEAGTYKVRVFVMDSEGEKETKYTEEVQI